MRVCGGERIAIFGTISMCIEHRYFSYHLHALGLLCQKLALATQQLWQQLQQQWFKWWWGWCGWGYVLLMFVHHLKISLQKKKWNVNRAKCIEFSHWYKPPSSELCLNFLFIGWYHMMMSCDDDVIYMSVSWSQSSNLKFLQDLRKKN